ncbi:MAG: ribosomal-protein-alanine N-acetyltransferase [Gammaproteobacteria bacterium]|nr:ribosomal-protein-alanine N-acetyltransferase [Gammaproteobacteria bacterium]
MMATAPRHLPLPEAVLRPMREDDVPDVVAAERDSYAFPWSEPVFRDCLRVGYLCRVLEVDGQLAGYGILSVGAGEAHILNVCVRPEHRCRGLGRQLVTALFDIARAAGAEDLFLEVRPSNTSAIRLYQSAASPSPRR